MIKRIGMNALISLPSLCLCGLAYFGDVENSHYGFANPGIDADVLIAIPALLTLAFIYSLVTLFIRHKTNVDFIFPYIVLILSAIRFFMVIAVCDRYFLLLN